MPSADSEPSSSAPACPRARRPEPAGPKRIVPGQGTVQQHGGWDRAARLDPTRVVRRLAELTGTVLTVEGRCPGGQVGAAYVRWPDGHPAVLSFGSARSARLVAIARAAGVPAAVYEVTADIDGATIVVQQRLPGTPPATVDYRLVDDMFAVNQRFAGLLADHPDIPAVELHLSESGPGYCRHEPLARYDRRTARLLGWVREVGADWPGFGGDSDLVHVDYHTGNVLVTEGRVNGGARLSGVVDWDGAGRGDRHLDLVTLRFDLAVRAPALGDRLDDLLRQLVPHRRLRAYWAHMSLRLVDWAIRHHTPADVERWLATAATGVKALG